MATVMAVEPGAAVAREGKPSARRASSATRNREGGAGEAQDASRFFLGSMDGKAPVFEREVTGEKEAMVESLRTGQSYFVVSEWKAVADLSKKVPEIRREAVRRPDRDRGGLPPVGAS